MARQTVSALRPSLGNQALQSLLLSRAVQAKLTVSQPGDPYEQEADRVADEVMRMPEPGAPATITPLAAHGLQKKCAACESGGETCPECSEEESVQRKEEAGSPAFAADAPPVPRGGGQPLPAPERSFFESRFGRDFSRVRVHTGAEADASARSFQALAYTHGSDIVFRSGQYDPVSAAGQRLLAHELTHVVQQGAGGAASATAALPQVQRKACANQRAVDDLIKKNPRKYPRGVKMHPRTIAKGDTLSNLAAATVKANKGTNVEDLTKELVALNKRLKTDTIGHCAVLIKGFARKRFRCDQRIAEFKKDKAHSSFKSWEEESVTKDDNDYESIVERVLKRRTNLFKGRKPVYAKEVKRLNDPWIGSLNEGECVALPVGWIDPNIGKLPPKPAATGSLTGEAAQAIATVYAEQTGTSTNAQKQQKFIWFSIRKRVETEVRGPSIAKVLPGEYNGFGNADYKDAIQDLKKKTPMIAAVGNARKIVLDNWTVALPKNAGAFYFHWRRDSKFLAHCYGKPKEGAAKKKEKECAWKWANKNGFVGTVKKAAGWHHRIKGDTPAPKERIGSMYIYL